MARGNPLKTLGLVGIPVGFILIFFVVPLAIMAVVSVAERGQFGGVQWNTFSTDAYVRFLYERDFDDSLIWNPAYAQILLRSVWLSLLTTVLCVLIGFPTALHMAMQPPPRRNLLIFLVTIPFWTNLLVRNYSWILLLRNGGVLDWALIGSGLRKEPLDVLYTPLATAIGLVYSFLPYMILPIYVSIEKIDRRYIEAAFDLGANRWRALVRVVVPLAMPGIVGGLILVFVPCLGAFISPELLGGAKSMMIGSLIQQQFGQARNWPFGAALAFVLLALILLALWIHAWRYRRVGTAA